MGYVKSFSELRNEMLRIYDAKYGTRFATPKLNKMETYKVFIDYVEGSGEVEWNCPHILLPHPVVTSCTCYRDAYEWGGCKS